jgi:hypothetical protein
MLVMGMRRNLGMMRRIVIAAAQSRQRVYIVTGYAQWPQSSRQ